MKRLVKALLAGILCCAFLFSFAACGGDNNAAVDRFVNAMKTLNMEKAAKCCMDADNFADTDPAQELAVEFTEIIDATTDDVKSFTRKMLKDCMRGFEYTVDSEEQTEEGKITLQLTCTNYNVAQAISIFMVAIAAQASASDVGKVPLSVAEKRFDIEMGFVKDAEKTETEATVILVEDEGEWKLQSGSQMASIMVAGSLL